MGLKGARQGRRVLKKRIIHSGGRCQYFGGEQHGIVSVPLKLENIYIIENEVYFVNTYF